MAPTRRHVDTPTRRHADAIAAVATTIAFSNASSRVTYAVSPATAWLIVALLLLLPRFIHHYAHYATATTSSVYLTIFTSTSPRLARSRRCRYFATTSLLVNFGTCTRPLVAPLVASSQRRQRCRRRVGGVLTRRLENASLKAFFFAFDSRFFAPPLPDICIKTMRRSPAVEYNLWGRLYAHQRLWSVLIIFSNFPSLCRVGDVHLNPNPNNLYYYKS